MDFNLWPFLIIPLVGPIINALQSWARGEPLPPFIPALQSYVIAQALTAAVTARAGQGQQSSAPPPNSTYILLAWIIVIIVQLGILLRQRRTTSAIVKATIAQFHFLPVISSAEFRSAMQVVAEQLIDPDYDPDSIPNQISGKPLEQKRKDLAQLLNLLREKGTKELDEQDFRVDPKQPGIWGLNITSVATAIASTAIYGWTVLTYVK